MTQFTFLRTTATLLLCWLLFMPLNLAAPPNDHWNTALTITTLPKIHQQSTQQLTNKEDVPLTIIAIFIAIFTWGYIMVMTKKFVSLLIEWYRIRGWTKIPAQILDVELVSDDSSGHVPLYLVKARYRYIFLGKTYESEHVSLQRYPDNDFYEKKHKDNEYYKKIYYELSEHLESQKSFPCYVNPNAPFQSILYGDLPWEKLFFFAFIIIFPGAISLGFVLMFIGDDYIWFILFMSSIISAGIYMAQEVVSALREWYEIRGWTEIPAQILNVELVEDNSSDEGLTYFVKIRYRYIFLGKTYESERVSLHEILSFDRYNEYYKEIYSELSEHLKTQKPFPCYVNPNAPFQSILYGDLPWDTVFVGAMLAVLFGGVGLLSLLGFLMGFTQN